VHLRGLISGAAYPRLVKAPLGQERMAGQGWFWGQREALMDTRM